LQKEPVLSFATKKGAASISVVSNSTLLVTKLGVGIFTGSVSVISEAAQSHALEADALHLAADIWTSIGVPVGLVAIKVTGLYWLDPVIAIVVDRSPD